MKNDLRNGLFQGLENNDLQSLNRSVARPIPLWSFMPLEVREGKKITIPVATMLGIVSSYETVLAVTDAIVPIIKKDEQTGKEEKLRRHFRYIDGKPIPMLTDRRSPLAFLNHEHLHRVLLQHDAQARAILRRKSGDDDPGVKLPGGNLPTELRDMVAGFRLIRAYRQKHCSIRNAMVQRWEIYKINEEIVKDTHPGKAPLIDPEKALTLDYTLQCPPVFEMMPRGFIPQLMRDLGHFMGRDEPILAETTTANKYKLWISSPVGQFHEMFAEEERQRQELIDARGENISAMPLKQLFKKKGTQARTKPVRQTPANRDNRAGNEAPPVAAPTEDQDVPDREFGLEQLVEEEMRTRQYEPAAIAVEEQSNTEATSFGISQLSVMEQDEIILNADKEDGKPQGPQIGWFPS